MENDLRVIKTKQAIEEAFVFLVESKGYSNVKLVDIAKKARVNRNTIYLHYSTKEDIITSLIANNFNKELAGFELTKYLKYRNNKARIEEMYKAIFNIITKDMELYRVLLLEDGLVGFFTIEIKKIKKLIYSKLKQTTKNDVVLTYILYGVFGVLNDFVVSSRGTVEENVKILSDLTMSGLRRLQY